MADSGFQIGGVSFFTYHPDDIRKLSVAQILNHVSYDNLQQPVHQGLYDQRLGPTQMHEKCVTCGLKEQSCPGHMGHIELPLVVYNPLFYGQMQLLLKCTCFYCHRLRVPRTDAAVVCAQLQLLDRGLLLPAMELDEFAGDMPEDEDGNRIADDSLFQKQVDEFCEKAIATAKANKSLPTRAEKFTHVMEFRRRILKQFLGAASRRKTCPCGGLARRILQESTIKVFAAALTKKQQQSMESKGLFEDTLYTPGGKASAAMRSTAMDVDSSGSGSGSDSSSSSDSEDEGAFDDGFEDGDDEDTDILGMAKKTAAARNKAAKAKAAAKTAAKSTATTTANLADTSRKSYLTPAAVKYHLDLLWENESELMGFIHGALTKGASNSWRRRSTADLFFFTVLPVSPNRYRPPSVLGDSTFENPSTQLMSEVLKVIEEIARNTAAIQTDDDSEAARAQRERMNARLVENWQNLQYRVNCCIDSSLDHRSSDPSAITPGIRQALERKEGLFRMHMMGKRVNYAARSVISPDPMIGSHEIGVPEVFAKKLTYPEPVTPWNVHVLRAAVLAGPSAHPGATHVEDEYGNLKVLKANDLADRQAVASQLLTPSKDGTRPYKRVYRHLRNGDWVLMNRQPTLHKSSIMAHQARVLPGERTLRMHYANCKTYNADFDGDEMNMHFPQNELGRAEASMIANTDNQYLALSGSPLRGLIQDHVIAGVRMTIRDSFFTRQQYQQLLHSALPSRLDNEKVITVTPCILKPVPLWSGKQIITSLLKNLTKGRTGLTLHSRAKIKNAWSAAHGDTEGEGTVIFRDGEMLCGLLDKSQCGATEFGLVHSCHEVFGGRVAGELLSSLGKLFTQYLKMDAITLGIDDLLLTPEAEKRRKELLAEARKCGLREAAEHVEIDPDAPDVAKQVDEAIETIIRDPGQHAAFDSVMMAAANKHQSTIIAQTCPNGLLKPFPNNTLQLMIQSGAKGSNVNASQISSLLGPQALEGRRVPIMASGKSLPCFPAFDPSARAGGLILNRFLTGIRPQEYFFHCMAGREGLVDTAVKTSRSGYLQRCLIKHLEDLKVAYDYTVRDADGSVVQFRYGDDSIDVTKAMQLENFEFMARNYRALLDKYGAANASTVFEGEYGKKALKLHSKAMEDPTLDPVLATLRPDRYFGCVSEGITRNLEAYVKKNVHGILASERNTGRPTKKNLKQLMHLNYVHSLAEPGEAVGILAAQAIGEPSTQMTLNTFHFAGRSDMNVTLGIPRLREIVMTASPSIKTPVMSVPLLKGDGAMKRAQRLRGFLRRVTLKDVLQSVSVVQSLAPSKTGERLREYEITFQFIAPETYREEFSMSPRELFDVLEKAVFKRILAFAKRSLKGSTRSVLNEIVEDGGRTNMHRGGDSDEEDEEEAGGAKEGAEDSDSSGDEDDSDADENMEDAGTLAKGKAKTGYGVDEDDESELDSDDDSDADSDDDGVGDSDSGSGSSDEGTAAVSAKSKSKSKSKDTSGKDKSGKSKDKGSKSKSKLSAAAQALLGEKSARRADVLATSQNISSYDFDPDGNWCKLGLRFPASNKRLLFVSILEKLAGKLVLRSTEGIRRCALSKSSELLDEPDTLNVEGMNLAELWKHSDVVDVNRIRANDVWAMLNTYGVEAARATLINAISEVFDVYGIKVNHRHLSLVADYMMFEGEYKGMNRMGMNSNVSPFLQMSFETTASFLRTATQHGDRDLLKSNSSRIVVGQPPLSGTGCLSLRAPLSARPAAALDTLAEDSEEDDE